MPSPSDLFTDANIANIVGPLQTNIDPITGTPGNATINGGLGGGVTPVATGAALALTSSGTIFTQGFRVNRVAPGSAVTANVLQKGNIDGQQISVINEAIAASSITFAASASSNVADGVTTVIAGLRSAVYTWDQTTQLWYHS